MNKRYSDAGGSDEVDDVFDMVEITNMIVTRIWKWGNRLGQRENGVKVEAEIFLQGSW